MASPYLVQRVSRKRSEFNKAGSVDDNYRMEYMGSAEFEMGALPKSLKAACASLDEYQVIKIEAIKDADDQPLRVLCKIADKAYQEDLLSLWVDEHSLTTKECVGLEQAKRPKGERMYEADVWWDVSNHIFFCFGKTNMKQWQTALENTREKFKAAGRI